MIALIEGKVIFSDGDQVILSTNSGVGYEIHCAKTFTINEKISLFIAHIVKETSEDLYGFLNFEQKRIFTLLLSVKGVGPKSAFSLASNLGVAEIVNAISFEDKKALARAPGVGAKAAAQIILDLKNKIGKITYSTHSAITPAAVPPTNSVLQETMLACKELGFREEQILGVAQKIMLQQSITKSEDLVNLVLKQI